MGAAIKTMSDPSQWLGLLRWSMAYQDGTTPTEAKAMSDEDKKWLTEAMEHGTVNEAKRMTQIMDRVEELLQGEAMDEAEVTGLFEELQDIVEQIDQAMNLHKTGNLARIIQLLRNERADIRAHAAEIIATCSQNNPKVQTVAIEAGALAYCAHLFVHDADVNVKVKALLAVSCLIRNFSPGESVFAQGDGPYVVCRGAQDEDRRVRTKAIFLLNYMLTQDISLREEAVVDIYAAKMMETGIAGYLVGQIGCGDVDIMEGVLQVLLKLLDHPGRCYTVLSEAGVTAAVEGRVAQLSVLEGEAKEDALTEMDLLENLTQRLKQLDGMKADFQQM